MVCWPAALSIWGNPFGGPLQGMPVSLDEAEWKDGKLVAGAMEPLTLERLAARAHELGLVIGVCVHTFSIAAPGPVPSSSWAASALLPRSMRCPFALAMVPMPPKRPRWTAPAMPFSRASRSAIRRCTAWRRARCTTRLAPRWWSWLVFTGSGKVTLGHKTWLECGSQIVPELVSGQLQGGVAMGIGHALYEEAASGAERPRQRGAGTSTATTCRAPADWPCGRPRAMCFLRSRAPTRPRAWRSGDDSRRRCLRQCRGARRQALLSTAAERGANQEGIVMQQRIQFSATINGQRPARMRCPRT